MDVDGFFSLPLLMKRPLLIIYIWIPCLFCVLPMRVYSQDYQLNREISVHIENKSVEEAIIQISEAGKVHFSYTPKILPRNTLINLHLTNQPLEKVLKELCRQADIDYVIVEQQIILKAGGSEANKGTNISKNSRTISGYIRDRNTGESLIGAAIFLPELKTGTISNAFGFFSITLPDGNFQAQVSYLGYRITEFEVTPGQTSLDIDMDRTNAVLDEVTVYPDNDFIYLNAPQMSRMDLGKQTVKAMPALMGEADVIKSFQSFPGIKLHGDGSTWFFVRGGHRDQNLILLDDAPIYNPSHLLGMFSTFIPDAVKDIHIYKGDLPARFGGRLSSLVDIRTNDGNLKNFALKGSISPISSRITLEIPVIRQKSSIALSARLSRLKWFFRMINPDVDDFDFVDLNTKMNFKLNDRNRIYLSFYSGTDFYSNVTDSFTSGGLRWQNNALTLRWNHVFNHKVFANTTIYTSNYDYRLFTSLENNQYWNSRIDNVTVKYDLSWYLNPGNTIFAGLRFSGHNLDPGNFYSDGQLGAQPVISKKHAREINVYAENEQDVSPRLSLRYGLRLSIWNNTGESVEYVYGPDLNPIDSIYYQPAESYHHFINLEPRLSVKYSLTDRTSLKMSYSRTTQYLHLITNSISPFTTLDVWLPSGPNIPDQKADQIALGAFHSFGRTGLILNAEGYFKMMRNQIDYVDHAEMLLNPFVETQLRFGNSKAYGIELQVKKTGKSFTGWINYTFSRVMRKTGGINSGREYPAFHDRPHEVGLFLAYDWTPRLQSSLNWYYSTGSALTMPTSFYYYDGLTLPIYQDRNNARFPDYHRMDFAMTFRLNRIQRRYRHQLGLSVFNLYGRQNPVFINYNKIESGDKYLIPGNLSEPPNLQTTNIFVYNIIPSITYHFQFQ